MTDQALDQPTTVVDLDEQTANDVGRLATLNDEIDERTKARDEIKTRLRDNLPAGIVYRFGGRPVLDLAAPVDQFDGDLAAAVVPPALLAQISVSKPDAKLARRILPAALFVQCCKPKAAAVKAL